MCCVLSNLVIILLIQRNCVCFALVVLCVALMCVFLVCFSYGSLVYAESSAIYL